ncbi:MAG TPA: YceD family protein [Burkholderiales bacterium]|nr:YceD family protein [Burkholderiales bacterium]
MSHQPVIDGFEFASAGAQQQGRMPISGFRRLRDQLASDHGEVEYAVRGVRDERGRPGLQLHVHGTLQLRCQRCLEPMAHEVDEEQVLVLAATLEEIEADPTDTSAPDRVLGGKQMDLRELVEDQLILALPYAPRHAGCRPAGEVDDEGTASPFAGLRGLLRKH